MKLYENTVGQFTRVVLAQAVAAALNAAASNLGLLHLDPVYVTILGAALHALDEYITKRLRA